MPFTLLSSLFSVRVHVQVPFALEHEHEPRREKIEE